MKWILLLLYTQMVFSMEIFSHRDGQLKVGHLPKQKYYKLLKKGLQKALKKRPHLDPDARLDLDIINLGLSFDHEFSLPGLGISHGEAVEFHFKVLK